MRDCHGGTGACPHEWHPGQTTALAEQRRAQLVSATRRWNTGGQRSGLWVRSGVRSRQHRTELILSTSSSPKASAQPDQQVATARPRELRHRSAALGSGKAEGEPPRAAPPDRSGSLLWGAPAQAPEVGGLWPGRGGSGCLWLRPVPAAGRGSPQAALAQLFIPHWSGFL